MIDRLIKISNRLWVGNFFVSLQSVKMNELNISKPTAILYLNQLCDCQNPFLQKIKIGRDNYYINIQLFNLLQNAYEMKIK